MVVSILSVRFPEHAEVLRDLFRQYEEFLGISLCFQDFEAELQSLPGKYAPPMGGCWIAWQEDKAVGCVAIRPLFSDGGLNPHADASPAASRLALLGKEAELLMIAEVKRLFVLPEMAGQGIGRKLMQRAINEARIRNYHALYLDTLTRLAPALQLYQSLGFEVIDPYNEGGVEGICYLGLTL